MSSIRIPLLLAVLALGGVISCTPETKLAAEGTGDLSNPAVARVEPDARQVEQCGAGTVTDAGFAALARKPYLQKVADASAEILFTARPGAEVVVDVTLPDGTAVASMPAERDPAASPSGAWQGVAQIAGLAPATLYCYSLRNLTARAGFVTANERGSDAKVSFIVWGDSGDGGIAQAALEEQMHTVPFDLMLHVGDVAYDAGDRPSLEWQFFEAYASLLRSFPSYLVAGNHDYRTAGAAPFREVFALPENGGPEGLERWYSFDWGNVHFVGLDTERIGATQRDWLEQDLGSNDLPWVVVFGHKPPLSSGSHGSNRGYIDTFVPVLERHGVQLVLSGHDHDYERFRPIAGITYVVTGGGGHGTRKVSKGRFTAFAEGVTHLVQVEIDGDTMLIHAIDAVGREFDSARITL